MRLEGKIALVAGASHGIIRAIALKLVGPGSKVAVNYVETEAINKMHADDLGVLTKKFFMFIMHRITIQNRIKYSLGFILFPIFAQGEIHPDNYMLKKSWSSEF